MTILDMVEWYTEDEHGMGRLDMNRKHGRTSEAENFYCMLKLTRGQNKYRHL
jgi:hypothetical protein